MDPGTKVYLTHRRNKPTKHQRLRLKAKVARRLRWEAKIAESLPKPKITEIPPLPAEIENPPLPTLTEEDERLQSTYKDLPLKDKIKTFRNSLCGSCLSNGINISCFRCFEENNRNYRIPKK